LYVGTLQPRKNLARVINAFAGLAGDPALAGVQLVLAGKRGWLYDDLFAQVTRLGLTSRVIFPGYVEEADLPALLSGALALVFPSLYEGFGIPVLEAMAWGCPAIVATGSALDEVLGPAGLTVDPADAAAAGRCMAHLWDHPEARAELAARGRQRACSFTWQRTAEATLAAYRTALDGGARTP
jgi:glycosyltransferase involved in cell wall biosynthesis